MTESTRRFYDSLAADYHLMFADWDASISRQATALDALILGRLGPGTRTVLDCACGIGTQAVGLAGRGHRVVGTDLSPVAAARATREATARALRLPAAAADMRALPLRPASVDVVVCADNALPHLLTPEDMQAALAGMRRVLRTGGLALITTRPYDEMRKARPPSSPPQVSETAQGRAIIFQLWHWHPSGQHYDFEYFQLRREPSATATSTDESWTVHVRRGTYWAITRRELADLAAEAAFTDIAWYPPEETGFYQPVLAATAAGDA